VRMVSAGAARNTAQTEGIRVGAGRKREPKGKKKSGRLLSPVSYLMRCEITGAEGWRLLVRCRPWCNG
jgi:hypothetical protein